MRIIQNPSIQNADLLIFKAGGYNSFLKVRVRIFGKYVTKQILW
jgi:hypothetical protein